MAFFIPFLDCSTTREGREHPRFKACLRLAYAILISTSAVLRNSITWSVLMMSRIISSIFAVLILTDNLPSSESHELDLSRLPGAYPAIRVACISPTLDTTTTISITLNTTTTASADTSARIASPEHGAWAIYNQKLQRVSPRSPSLPRPEVKTSSRNVWRPQIVKIPAALMHNVTTTIFDIEENQAVLPTTKVPQPSPTPILGPSGPPQSVKLTLKRLVGCKNPNAPLVPAIPSSANCLRWAPYAPRKLLSTMSPGNNTQMPPTHPLRPTQFSKLAGAPSGPFPGLKRLKGAWPMEMEIDVVSAESVLFCRSEDVEMSDVCGVGAQEEDIDMVSCASSAEMIYPPGPGVVPAEVKQVTEMPVEKLVKQVPVKEPSSDEFEFDDDLPPAGEIPHPQAPVGRLDDVPVEKLVNDLPVKEPSSDEFEFDDDLPLAEEIPHPQTYEK
ncbi:hypothetical protein BGX38DRAFT_1183454 [Terfezia claveryi]|nr:hypothetical protein BGX38DRAFT_1183454 [Terfezia claveryi]